MFKGRFIEEKYFISKRKKKRKQKSKELRKWNYVLAHTESALGIKRYLLHRCFREMSAISHAQRMGLAKRYEYSVEVGTKKAISG